MTIINKFFNNDNSTRMYQILFSLCYGILISPWSGGLVFLIFWTLIYELLIYIFTKGNPRYYNVFTRTGVIYSYFLGYIIGRTLLGDDILWEGKYFDDKYINKYVIHNIYYKLPTTKKNNIVKKIK